MTWPYWLCRSCAVTATTGGALIHKGWCPATKFNVPSLGVVAVDLPPTEAHRVARAQLRELANGILRLLDGDRLDSGCSPKAHLTHAEEMRQVNDDG